MAQLTQARLRELLHYDPDTGVWTWRVPKGRAKAGQLAGFISKKGYRRIKIDRSVYFSHNLAVFYMTGQWAPEEVDHKDCDRANDRWINLRPCTQQQNSLNRSIRSDNTSGFKGVSWNKRGQSWQARVGFKKREISLGHHRTPEAAAEAVRIARLRLHGEFARDK
jgi:hypothetical protein